MKKHTLKKHTIEAASITAREIQVSNLPPLFIDCLLTAATWMAELIAASRILQSDDNDNEADLAIGELTSLVDEAWRMHSKPTDIDPDYLRLYFDERLAAAVAAASGDSARDEHDDADASLVR